MADVVEQPVTNDEGTNENLEETQSEETTHFTFEDGQLTCLGQDVEEIPPNLIADYCKVTRRLDLSFNRLQTLTGLEQFVSLEELVLDNNELNDDLRFPAMKSLHTVTLNKNKITNLYGLLENLKSQLPELTYLSLLGNTACPNQLSSRDKDEEDYQRYRYYVLFQLPTLKFLDSSPVKASELTEAKRVGCFMKVVKADQAEPETKPGEKGEDSLAYTPLDQRARDSEQHAGTYGKSKYIYYGRHSEGNRFIRNNDL